MTSGTVSEESGTTLAAVEVFDLEHPESSFAVREQAATLAELVGRLNVGLERGIAATLGEGAQPWPDRPVADLGSRSEPAMLAVEQGHLALARGDLSAAVRAFGAAVESDASFVRAHMARARALYAAGLVNQARQAADEAERQVSRLTEPPTARLRLELDALSCRVREDRKAEETAMLKLVAAYPDDPEVRWDHSPKNCLPGAGWEALASTRVEIPGPDGPGRVNRYLLKNGDAQALVLYWYQGRGRIESNEYVVKWDLLRDAALRQRSDEALVRVVVPVTDSDESAFDLTARVAEIAIPAVAAALPD